MPEAVFFLKGKTPRGPSCGRTVINEGVCFLRKKYFWQKKGSSKKREKNGSLKTGENCCKIGV